MPKLARGQRLIEGFDRRFLKLYDIENALNWRSFSIICASYRRGIGAKASLSISGRPATMFIADDLHTAKI